MSVAVNVSAESVQVVLAPRSHGHRWVTGEPSHRAAAGGVVAYPLAGFRDRIDPGKKFNFAHMYELTRFFHKHRGF